MEYGDVRLQPMAYQDDIMKGSKDVKGAQAGNTKLSAMFKDKSLTAHPDKTCYIVCGSKNFKTKVEQDLIDKPLVFDTFNVKQRVSDKYLGQVLQRGGLGCSATATVHDRKGRIKGATLEIRSIVEEYPMQAIGGLMAARELWERALIPSLLSEAGTWIGDCKEAIDICDDLQNFFLESYP